MDKSYYDLTGIDSLLCSPLAIAQQKGLEATMLPLNIELIPSSFVGERSTLNT